MATETEQIELPLPPEPKEPPLFLIGAERSGTTMLRLMLEHHPQIAFSSEFEYVVDYMADAPDFPDPADFVKWLSSHRRFATLDWMTRHGPFPDPESPEPAHWTYPQLVRMLLVFRHIGSAKPIIGATIHRRFARILRIWPEARFIYIVRDGRDVARSSVGMGWAGNVYCAVEDWIEREAEWERLRSTLPTDRYVEVRFEDLIASSDAELMRICDFVGVPFDRAMYNYAKSSTYGLPDPKLVYQWRRKYSVAELRQVESRIADRLRQRGYELSGHPPMTVGPLRRWWLNQHSRIGRLGFRIKRYGIRLWLTNAYTARFGTESMRQNVRQRINEIDRTHLK